MERKVRVRFAPSPTGPLHIGGVRTALYNFLFARKHGGDFLLRIEDTDQTRFVPGAEEYIIESLKWCGIQIDEGVSVGGPHAPYRQSERKEIYKKYALQLVEQGDAYYAFDTPEELEEKRKEAEAVKGTFQYDATTRHIMKNSTTMTTDEVKSLLNSGVHYVIRFKNPANEEVIVHDIIRGEVTMQTSLLDDKVLYKSDGMPTYHLANVVDDYLMQITHVVRGEEWLPSAPLHVLLYRKLGWESVMPKFAHLPLLLKPEGNGKLSKRDGDRLGFPVFPLRWTDPKTNEVSSGYRESGYYSDAFINMLAFLGWNPGTNQELFSMDELIQAFTFDRVGKSGSKFDFEKAKWFNQQYLKAKDNKSIANDLLPLIKSSNINCSEDKLEQICGLIKERCTFAHEIINESTFLFDKPTTFDQSVIVKKWKPETPAIIETYINRLKNNNDITAQALETDFKNFLQENNLKMGDFMPVLRILLTGAGHGPSLFDIMVILGKEECLERLNNKVA